MTVWKMSLFPFGTSKEVISSKPPLPMIQSGKAWHCDTSGMVCSRDVANISGIEANVSGTAILALRRLSAEFSLTHPVFPSLVVN